jgi:radical SAM superfamily enzyme YgiQ (UPF0313 family)
MRVLLVNTNLMKPPVAPIGLDYLADSIRAAGHEPRLLDLCFSDGIEKDITAAAGSFEPDVIGVSVRNTDDCYFASGAFFLPGIRDVVASLRRASDAPIVMGGVGFSVMPEAVMDFCGADLGIAGEGEEAFVRLLEALRTKSGLAEVAGLIWREKGALRRNPPVDSLLDLLPSRTRSLVDNRRYFREGGQAGFETKRGCAMTCLYCADPVSKGRRVRLRSPRLVVKELQALLGQGIDHFHTCDCEFNLPVEHAREICQAIIDSKVGERIRWYAYCAITPFDEDTALLFKRAGCAGIDFGADSGNLGMLRRLGRPFDPEDILQTARCCRTAGIPFMYDLLIGGPGETRESVRETIDLMRRAEPDCVGVSLGIRVYDGTPIADFVRSQGDMTLNQALHGAKEDNPQFLRPVFYLSPDIGEDTAAFVRDLVGTDERFFLPSGPEAERDCNYNDNALLSDAIAKGARGAYWDILRRLRKGG